MDITYQLATRRNLFEESFLKEKCAIYRPVKTSGQLSSDKRTYALLVDNVDCAIEARTRRDSRGQSKEILNIGDEYLLKVNYRQEILQKDVIRLYAPTGGEVSDYSVKSLFDRRKNTGILKRAILDKLPSLISVG